MSQANRDGVDYVVLGGAAAWLPAFGLSRMASLATDDRHRDHPYRPPPICSGFSVCLKELDARIRSLELPERIPFGHNGATLATVRV
jgi:hypothetical protein